MRLMDFRIATAVGPRPAIPYEVKHYQLCIAASADVSVGLTCL
jgi:lipopolysaccharide/colanic/teichoic acid biosynthesis glycosyltransferase